MRFKIKTKEHKDQWHDYFVWFPTILRDSDTGFLLFIWLETVRVRRKYCKWGTYWQYRTKE